MLSLFQDEVLILLALWSTVELFLELDESVGLVRLCVDEAGEQRPLSIGQEIFVSLVTRFLRRVWKSDMVISERLVVLIVCLMI
jgi:hypothetical protein